jgi:hypothetical protein
MVAVEMRVDEISDRLFRDRFNGGLDPVMQRRVLAVDHDDTVLGHRHRDIAALALEHVDVVAEIGGPDFDFRKIRRRRCGRRLLRECRRGPRENCGGGQSHPVHASPPRFDFQNS